MNVGNDYYKKAIIWIKERVSDPTFVVFSDDIQWVKDNLKFDSRVLYSEYKGKNGAIFDLKCMSLCKHGIMSASTFSWWGNYNKKGIVILPDGLYCNNMFANDGWVKL